MSTRTPTPWHVKEHAIGRKGEDRSTYQICDASRGVLFISTRRPHLTDDEDRANAEHIVRCVNHHDDLVTLVRIMSEDVEYDDEGNEGYWEDGLFFPEVPTHVQRARKILAKLKGGAK